MIGTTTEPEFMGGECQRVSIFLSVIDVHVQNAPVSGKVACFKYTTGQFLNALKAESAIYNENVLLGFEASEPRGQKVGVRLIAGVIARRIVPFVQQGDEVARGDRDQPDPVRLAGGRVSAAQRQDQGEAGRPCRRRRDRAGGVRVIVA